jgi:hypothetical protein
MIAGLMLIALVTSGFALYFGIAFYMMRLRAAYWESQVQQDSAIRHQWLAAPQPTWGPPKQKIEFH